MYAVTERATEIRPYQPSDEQSWLRCRVLGFLDTAYFDDVKNRRTTFANPAVELVAVVGEQVVGLVDVEVFGELATIDTIALHPDHRRAGTGRALLDAALARLPRTVTELDAWTRDDEAANAWYRATGFEVRHEYLHVYAVPGPFQHTDGLDPVVVLAHGRDMADEARMRAEHDRVHVCRRYVRDVSGTR
jgi:ribosomal protein S18 acetylase RimI-like enzyme